MWIPGQLRIKRAVNHAYRMLTMIDPVNLVMDQEISTRWLSPRSIVHQETGIVVTEAGFVTMAILIEHALERQGLVAVPGVDDRGQRGFLVMRERGFPFHSLKSTADEAIDDALANARKADALVQQCNGKANMLRMVDAAPWNLCSTYEDFMRSGLCLWGTESFLRRLGLLGFARRFGLPRLLLKLAGPYGVRLTASTLLRRQNRDNNELPAPLSADS